MELFLLRMHAIVSIQKKFNEAKLSYGANMKLLS